MKRRKKTKNVHEGRYVAAVEVELIEDETGWSPYLSVEEASRMDAVREALRHPCFEDAARYGRLYELQPITPPEALR